MERRRVLTLTSSVTSTVTLVCVLLLALEGSVALLPPTPSAPSAAAWGNSQQPLPGDNATTLLSNSIFQVCVVVTDIDTQAKIDLALGASSPIYVYQFNSSNVLAYYDKWGNNGTDWVADIAGTSTFKWEIIQPIAGDNLYQRFLDVVPTGGFHHMILGNATDEFETEIAGIEAAGGEKVAYLNVNGAVQAQYMQIGEMIVEIYQFLDQSRFPKPYRTISS